MQKIRAVAELIDSSHNKLYFMKKVLVTLFTLFVLLPPTDLLAWGLTGHRVVGQVAQNQLSAKAKRKISKILDCNSLAEISNHMDDIKSDRAYDHTHDWHWVTIPAGHTYEQTKKNPNGDLILKIEELKRTLKSGKLTKQEEKESLIFLVHLVGDLHQPMHVGALDDQGGNQVRVQWFGRPSNLHRIWDSDMIDDKKLSYTELTGFLNLPDKKTKKEWQSRSLETWVKHIQSFHAQAYELPEDKKLGYDYAYKNFRTVQQCLLEGGIHLAGILKEIYG